MTESPSKYILKNDNKIDEVTLTRLRKEREESLARQMVAPAKFLVTWKKAVDLAGARLFTNHRDHAAPTTTSEAVDKWQLIPNYEVINDYLGVASTGEALFITVLYSFYNSQEGEKMVQEMGYNGLGDIANRLEHDQLDIVTDLMRYHTGW